MKAIPWIGCPAALDEGQYLEDSSLEITSFSGKLPFSHLSSSFVWLLRMWQMAYGGHSLF